jgi:hypothetical protein
MRNEISELNHTWWTFLEAGRVLTYLLADRK